MDDYSGWGKEYYGKVPIWLTGQLWEIIIPSEVYTLSFTLLMREEIIYFLIGTLLNDVLYKHAQAQLASKYLSLSCPGYLCENRSDDTTCVAAYQPTVDY